jgi:hypothetical protein
MLRPPKTIVKNQMFDTSTHTQRWRLTEELGGGQGFLFHIILVALPTWGVMEKV